jgi:hypothetical protein
MSYQQLTSWLLELCIRAGHMVMGNFLVNVYVRSMNNCTTRNGVQYENLYLYSFDAALESKD